MSDFNHNVQQFSFDPRQKPYFVRPPEVARQLGLSSSTVRRLLRSGKIPGEKIGKLWVVPRARFEQYVEELLHKVEMIQRRRAAGLE